VSIKEELSLGHAMELISNGVPAFKGHKRPVPHSSDHYYCLFATAAGNKGDETDAANLHDSMTQLMTFRLLGSGHGATIRPWETMEQPSYAFCFGKRPGTITLNHWFSMSSVMPQAIALRDPGVAPREVDLETILERIRDLERGLEDDDEDLMYKNLYRKFLKDPDRVFNPHKSLDKQIADLIVILSRGDWTDFTNPRQQIATRVIFDTEPANHDKYVKFFYQLLLSIELDLRINSRQHLDEAKEKLLLQIPPTIQWNLALARRWRDFVRIEEYGPMGNQVRLRLKLKRRQVKMLKRFAQMMKWPNLAATLAVLKQRDADSTLDMISSHAMAFFSGLVLPGPTFPFLIMNALIDLDPDHATDELALLTHLHPHCGFQYRNSYTYWTAACIVGKVLAPTCRSVAGWVGPARPTVDLARSQIARIRSRRATRQPRVTPEDALSTHERSDPLGPPASAFPVAEYDLPIPDTFDDDGTSSADGVRVELLSLHPCGGDGRAADAGPKWYEASVQVAVDGVSYPLRLDYDVNFVCAWPCSEGPHPLFFDYGYSVARSDELVEIDGWNGRRGGGVAKGNGQGQHRSARASPAVGLGGKSGPSSPVEGVPATSRVSSLSSSSVESHSDDLVLVVEAFGVPDNEVLARAWCSQWGLNAVVADIGRTW